MVGRIRPRSLRPRRQRGDVYGDRGRRRSAVSPGRPSDRRAHGAPSDRGAGRARSRAGQRRGRGVKRVAAAAVVAALAVPLLVAATSGTAAADTAKPKARRLLVISLPGVTWEDIQDRVHELPDLTRVADG